MVAVADSVMIFFLRELNVQYSLEDKTAASAEAYVVIQVVTYLGSRAAQNLMCIYSTVV